MRSPAAVAVRIAAAERDTGGVRPFDGADIPAVVRLWTQCFPFDRPAQARLPVRIATVFLDNPWPDPDLPSLVYEDGRGAPIGFLGVIPRPMSLDGVPLRAAVSTHLMVHPGHRGAAALRLLQTFLQGPQDLSLADLASAGSRVLWERLGGTVAAPYCLQWCRLLAPARAALAGLAPRTRSRAIEVLARAIGGAADAALQRIPGSPFRRRPPRCRGEALSNAALLGCLEASATGYALRPRYTPSSLAWLLGVLEGKLCPLRRVRVLDGDVVIGWYVYGLAGHVGKVLRLSAARGRFRDVMDHLLDDAFGHGAALVTDRLEPRLVPEMDDALYVVRRAAWVLAHSRSMPVLDAIARGDAVLSRMEGEWWASP